MEWTEILNFILGGTSLLGGVQAVRFWKKSKRQEEADTQLKEIEAERAKMQLGDEYLQRVFDLSEKTYQATLKNGTDNDKIIKKVDELATTTNNIVAYLNGGFQEYLKNQ